MFCLEDYNLINDLLEDAMKYISKSEWHKDEAMKTSAGQKKSDNLNAPFQTQ